MKGWQAPLKCPDWAPGVQYSNGEQREGFRAHLYHTFHGLSLALALGMSGGVPWAKARTRSVGRQAPISLARLFTQPAASVSL